jgi:hypothetical protein
MRPGEAMSHLKERFPEIKPNTIYRYFQQYKKLPKDFQNHYSLDQIVLRKPDLLKAVVEYVSKSYGMSEEEVLFRLQQPWGLHQLLRGLWPNPLKREEEEEQKEIEEARRQAIDSCATILTDIALAAGNNPEELTKILREILDKVLEARSSKAADLG